MAVSVFAVSNTEDLDPIAVVVIAEAVVAEAQAELGRINIGDQFHVAFRGGEKAGQTMQQIDGGLAVDVANVSLGLVSPGNLLSHISPEKTRKAAAASGTHRKG